MSKRTESKKKVFDFTGKVKQQLDEVYLRFFSDVVRIDDKVRYKRNDQIACLLKYGDVVISNMEKFVHYKPGQNLYFELKHLNANGKESDGVCLRSQADIISYAIYDDSSDLLKEVYVLKMKYLRPKAMEQLRLFRTAKKSSIKVCQGEQLKTGIPYKVFSFEFDPKTLPEEAFVHFQDQRIMLEKE